MSFYFAYGSNMWLERMKKRCPDHTIVGTGMLTGYRWIISSRGYANIVKSTSDVVYGVVYEISSPDERNLDVCEGVARGAYRKEWLSVVVNGRPMTCLVYVDPIQDEGLPKEEYIRPINAGIEDAGLLPDYVQNSIRRFVPPETMQEEE